MNQLHTTLTHIDVFYHGPNYNINSKYNEEDV